MASVIPPHSTCADTIKDGMARRGVEVTVSELPPLVPSKWSISMRCPHKIAMHFEPTGDQLAAWRRDLQP